MAYRLPLTMTIRRISKSATAIEIETVIHDAEGTSVRARPFSVGPQRSEAEVCQILQHDVSQLAQALHARGEASIEAGESADEDIEALTGRTFIGSVAA